MCADAVDAVISYTLQAIIRFRALRARQMTIVETLYLKIFIYFVGIMVSTTMPWLNVCCV